VVVAAVLIGVGLIAMVEVIASVRHTGTGLHPDPLIGM
jgi:hypothetical protein